VARVQGAREWDSPEMVALVERAFTAGPRVRTQSGP
jgi:hypothetical protein